MAPHLVLPSKGCPSHPVRAVSPGGRRAGAAATSCRAAAFPSASARWERQRQGLILVHSSAQLEPCLTHKNTLHTINTPQHRLDIGYTTPTHTPYTIKSAQVELGSERV